MGLAFGDAVCAPYEGGIAERLLWQLIGKTRGRKRYTDDTQMTIDLCRSLIVNNGINQTHLAKEFADSYRWSRGYGPSSAWLLKKIRSGGNWKDYNRKRFPQGSYGNGAAMRASAIGLYFQGDEDKIVKEAERQGEITHAHSLALEGAKLIALVISWAIDEMPFPEVCDNLVRFCKSELYAAKIELLRKWADEEEKPGRREIVKSLGNGIAAPDSCVTAIYIALRYRLDPIIDMTGFVQKCGGDADTIGAMAGAIWGAYNGINRFSEESISNIENSELIISLAYDIFDKVN
jgi:poly(ADP-ribose) glycohydrolase ARH3